MGNDIISRNRRLSHDEISSRAPRRFLIDVEETMRIVLEQEDTDRDFQVGVSILPKITRGIAWGTEGRSLPVGTPLA